MPSFFKTLLAAANAALFLAVVTSPFAAVTTSAAPMPLPLQSKDWMRSADIDYASNNFARSSAAPAIADPSDIEMSSLQERDLLDLSGLLGYYGRAERYSNDYRELASRSSKVGDNDLEYQRRSRNALNGYQTNILGFKNVFGRIGDKGLSNYDRSSDLEELLKQFVNLNKETLNAVDIMAFNLPGGEFLGPLVYDIKCVIDDVLNTSENLIDSLLNGLNLQHLFGGLVLHAKSSSCKTGLLGLCL